MRGDHRFFLVDIFDVLAMFGSFFCFLSRVMGSFAVWVWVLGRSPDNVDGIGGRVPWTAGGVAYRRVWRAGQAIGWSLVVGVLVAMFVIAYLY